MTHERLGLFVRIWRYLFGVPALPAGDPGPGPATDPQCGSTYCRSRADHRCEAGNCTAHCSMWCPSHRCGKQAPAREVRYVGEETATLRDVADLFRSVVPTVASIVTCACGQKNRVRHSDYGKAPVCGRCKRALGLPS